MMMGVSPALVERIRGEFLEMPGLKLTRTQACRLWSLDEAMCESALTLLVSEGFLCRTASGAFIALPSAAAMLKADIPEPSRRWRCPNCQHLNVMRVEDAVLAAPRALRCTACAKLVNLSATA
jgi:hypothetical protein